MKLNTLTAMLVVGALVGTPALAGYKYNMQVYVDTVNRSARGQLGDARASSDNVQYIGCSTRAYPTSISVVCHARNASGVTATCTGSASTFLQAVATIAPDSSLYFQWDANGNCTYIAVDNYSSSSPKAP